MSILVNCISTLNCVTLWYNFAKLIKNAANQKKVHYICTNYTTEQHSYNINTNFKMKRVFKYFLALVAVSFAFAACKEDEPKEVAPVFSIAADQQFKADRTASVSVIADKDLKKDAVVVFILDQASTLAADVLSFDESATIKAGTRSASITVSLVADKFAELASGDYKAVFAAKVDDADVSGTATITTTVEKVPALERVWGFYNTSETKWYANTNITAVSIAHPDGYGMARSLAMDDEYVYLPKSSGYAALAAVSIANPETQVAGKVTGIAGGSTFVSSFTRVIKNTDAEVNGGKDVLLLCNLTSTDSDANQLRVYAYKDGINSAPTQIAGYCWDGANNVNDWRRYGDRFFVTGDWSNAKLYVPSFNAGKSVILSIANGARTAVTQITAGEDSPNGIKDVTVYPGTEAIFLTNNDIANLISATGGDKTNGWDTYAKTASSDKGKGTFGYNFFTFNGKNYIAYARISGETKAWIEVIEDKGDLLTSLNDQTGLLKSPIHDASNLEKEAATGNLADCCVRVINDVVYIAALTRDGGFVLDKLIMK